MIWGHFKARESTKTPLPQNNSQTFQHFHGGLGGRRFVTLYPFHTEVHTDLIWGNLESQVPYPLSPPISALLAI